VTRFDLHCWRALGCRLRVKLQVMFRQLANWYRNLFDHI
jgi:hypothetical protein